MRSRSPLEKSRVGSVLYEAEPDQVERCAHAQKESNKHKGVAVMHDVMINEPANAAPDQKAREQVSKD